MESIERIGAASSISPTQQSQFPPRPKAAVGTFLRIITINDVYKLDNYPRVATAVESARSSMADLDCVVSSHLNGDFLSPCTLTALDGGKVMSEAVNHACIDFVCLGNHEFDIGAEGLAKKLGTMEAKAINSNCTNAVLDALPRFATLTVGARTVVFGGFATPDLSSYRPSARPVVEPIDAATFARTWTAAKDSLQPGAPPAELFVPMTHQLVPQDKASAEDLAAQQPELAARTPIILGGHEHDVYLDQMGKSQIVKVGQDAESIGVVDIWWNADGAVETLVTLMPSSDFALKPSAQAFVEQQASALDRMMDMPLFALPAPPPDAPSSGTTAVRYSSKKVRFEEAALASLLLSFAKRGLVQDGVELVVLQAGAVRAKRDYEEGASFKLGDLFSELAFDCELAIIKLPGGIIADSITSTRARKTPNPTFLHLDEDAQCTPPAADGTVAWELTHINGEPLDRERLYSVAIYQFLLTGMNDVEPLMTYVRAGGDANNALTVPDLEACPPTKQLIIEVCMKDAWRELLQISKPDASAPAPTSASGGSTGAAPEAPSLKLSSSFSQLDLDNDGEINADDLKRFVTRTGKERRGTVLVGHMIQSLDRDGNGMVSLKEFEQLLQ